MRLHEQGHRALMSEGEEKAKDGFTSSWCRASVGKEHSFHERRPALSIMSATKDEEDEW